MEYNFTSISADVLEDLDKKLNKIKSNFQDDVSNFIRLLNDEAVIEKRIEIDTVIGDIFNDQIKATTIQFTECLNKVNRALAQYF